MRSTTSPRPGLRLLALPIVVAWACVGCWLLTPDTTSTPPRPAAARHQDPAPAPPGPGTPAPSTAPAVTVAEAHAVVEAYYQARSRWTDPSDVTDLVAFEEGNAALVNHGAADRVRRYGATRTATEASTYRYATAVSIDVHLPPPTTRTDDQWFLATVVQRPPTATNNDVRRPEYLWFHRGADNRWRTAWWLMPFGWRGPHDVDPPAVGPGGTWIPPTDPAGLATDPADVCRKLAVTQDVTNPAWEQGVSWGPEVRRRRSDLAGLWEPGQFGRFLSGGGTRSVATAVWPAPVGQPWQLADGRVMVPCAITYEHTLRPAPGHTVDLWDTAFEQTIDQGLSTRWSRWTATYTHRSLVVIPRKGGQVDYAINASWPLWADGDRAR